ncbi:MAG TPA: MBL fold metallo-hydrolase [Dongiaceae bacterium]
METKIDEIAAGIYRLSTCVRDDTMPDGFTFNQFLVAGDEPLLFHCGPRGLFPLISAALARIMPLERLRWITIGHVEADECGSMNAWLAAAPRAQVAHGMIACMVSLEDLADRAPRRLTDGEVIDLGGKQVRYIDTPHVPHGWEAGLVHELTTNTLCCGDILTRLGDGPPLTSDDPVGPAIAAEEMFGATSLGPTTALTIRKLAALAPKTLAIMHGPAYAGDARAALGALADYYEKRLQTAMGLA